MTISLALLTRIDPVNSVASFTSEMDPCKNKDFSKGQTLFREESLTLLPGGLSRVSPFFNLLLVYEHQIGKTANMRIH